MNVGIVSWWFNRGQATVARHVRSILEELGHRTFVLARPTPSRFVRPGFVDSKDVWDQPGVTEASSYRIPTREYKRWARHHGLDAIFCDQNYQFRRIARLRAMGIKTIGRFVWERFRPEDAPGAREAFDVVYSLTRCEQARYREEFGMETPFVPWGCHPELTGFAARRREDAVFFFYPGGYLSERKPTRAVVESFSKTRRPELRLLLKTQRPLCRADVSPARQSREPDASVQPGDLDPRILIDTRDLPAREYYETLSSCHVCIAPSRWEGLGLHLYEAAAFGLPVITNDAPPMNELIRDGDNGLLVASRVAGSAKSGIPAHEPDAGELSAAIEAMAEPALREKLSQNMAAAARGLAWQRTVEGFDALLKF